VLPFQNRTSPQRGQRAQVLSALDHQKRLFIAIRKERRVKKWLFHCVLALAVLYISMTGLVAYAVTRPPEQFGQIMKHLPMPLVFRVLPGRPLYLWAREGRLAEGDSAPDFALPAHDGSGTVTLSSFRGQRPVVLVFGSYT
jgi:hypothetical protein